MKAALDLLRAYRRSPPFAAFLNEIQTLASFSAVRKRNQPFVRLTGT